MGDDNPIQREKQWHSPDIEDEEKFLYGEDKEEKSVGQASTHQPQSKVVAQPEIGHCLVGRSGIAHHRMSQPGVDHLLCRKPAVGTQQRTTGIGGQRSKIAPSRHQEIQPGDLNRLQEIKPGTGLPQKRQPDSVGSQQRQPVVDHNPPKPSENDQDAPTVDEPQDPQEFERIQNLLKTIGLDIGEAEFSKMAARTQERLYGKKPAAGSSRRSERERELRGVARRSWETHDSPTKSPVSDYNRSISPSPTRRPSHEYSSKEEGKKLKQIQRLGENKHTPTPHSEFQLQQAGYDQYGNNIGTSPSQEPHSSTSVHQSNLRVIETVSLNENRVQQKSSNSMNLKVFGEAERLTQEEEARLKKKENIIMELERLQKLQGVNLSGVCMMLTVHSLAEQWHLSAGLLGRVGSLIWMMVGLLCLLASSVHPRQWKLRKSSPCLDPVTRIKRKMRWQHLMPAMQEARGKDLIPHITVIHLGTWSVGLSLTKTSGEVLGVKSNGFIPIPVPNPSHEFL